MEAVAFNAFSALGEPNRLRIVDLLRTGPFAVGDIAEALALRQPQVSKHLKVLGEAGLVANERSSRHRIYHLRREPFDAISDWAGSFEHLWDTRLDALGEYLEAITQERTNHDPNDPS